MDLNDIRMKGEFYPEVNKKNLLKEKYIAAKSSHSRGSTVDLTIVALTDNLGVVGVDSVQDLMQSLLSNYLKGFTGD